MGEHSLVATDLLQGLPEAFERTREAAASQCACWNDDNCNEPPKMSS
jgi:hypothetical protein